MEPMDELFELYNRDIDRLENVAQELNELYPQPADLSVRRKSREQFEAYVSGPPSESKRHYLLGLLAGQRELLKQLPPKIQGLVRQAA